MSTVAKRMSIIFILLFGSAVASPTPPDDRLEMSRKVASQMLCNYQQVQTWKGSASIVDRVRVGPEIASRERLGDDSGTCLFYSSARVEFAVDLESDSLSCSYNRDSDGAFELPGGKVVTAEGTSFHQDSIVTPEHYLHSDPGAKETSRLRERFSVNVKDFHRNRVATRQDASVGRKLSEASMVFDPRLTFTFAGRQYWEYPELFSKWLEKGKIESLALDRIADPVEGVKYTHTLSDGTKTIVLDSASGWLPVQMSSSGSWGSLELSVQYQEIDGIFVPLSYHRLQTDQDGIVAERIVEYTRHVLNKPIGEQQFTYVGLGVGDGTRVIDEIKGESLRLLDGEVVSDSEFVEWANEGRE